MAVLPLAQANAATADPLIEGAKLCTRHLPRYEREYAIPTHLLSAIASTESGRFHNGLKMNLPWPWAVNAAGKSYYYESKEEAIAAVKKLRARGIRSIDVGCMQVNLSQHPDAFATLDQAFEPQTNIAYAASFLHSLYEDAKSWKKAATYYHSRTPSLGQEYAGSVYTSWYTIIDKLRAARLHVPESSVIAMNEMKSGTKPVRPSTQVTTRVNPHVVRVASRPAVAAEKPIALAKAKSKAPAQAEKKLAAHKSPRMNSIKVSTVPKEINPERTRSIIVIREASAAPQALPEVKMADSAPLQTPIPSSLSPAATTMSDISLPSTPFALASDRRPVMASVGRKAGPSFIFND